MGLEKLGWDDRFRSLFDDLGDRDLQPARVVRVDRGGATIDTGESLLTATSAGRVSREGPIGGAAVGDWVAVDATHDSIIIRAILPRSGTIARRRPGSAGGEQVFAANVDSVLVVESLERGPNPRRIERAAAIAWDGGASPLVVLTKADLCSDLEGAIAIAREGAPFSEIVAVSAVSGDGIEAMEYSIGSSGTKVLIGPSGVGKSTLINSLLGEEKFAVGEVREGDRKGRHTTTHRELVTLPAGGCLIDTPGIRELGLWLDADSVATVFPEIEEAAGQCRFGDCRHETEPGCAVLEAVENGVVDEKRLRSFLRLRREAESADLRRDETRRYEIRARERSFGKMVREAMKIKKNR